MTVLGFDQTFDVAGIGEELLEAFKDVEEEGEILPGEADKVAEALGKSLEGYQASKVSQVIAFSSVRIKVSDEFAKFVGQPANLTISDISGTVAADSAYLITLSDSLDEIQTQEPGYNIISAVEVINENYVAVTLDHHDGGAQRVDVWHREDTSEGPASDIQTFLNGNAPVDFSLHFFFVNHGFSLDGAYYRFDPEDSIVNAIEDIPGHFVAAIGSIDGTQLSDLIDDTYVDPDGDVIADDGQIILAGDGDDSIFGGGGDDRISGEAGNDALSGGAGFDTAVFEIVFADASISASGSNLEISTQSTGVDIVQNDIELIEFYDVTYTFSEMQAFATNADPVTTLDIITVAEDQVAEIDVIANDTDPEGDPLEVNAVDGQPIGVAYPVTLASGAIVSLLPSGALSYDPNGAFDALNEGETATETITYTVSDGQTGTSGGTLTVTVNGVTPAPSNVAPTVADETVTVQEDDAQPTEIDVLTNDSDVDGDALSVTAVAGQAISIGNPVTLASGAEVSLLSNGSLSYDQNGAFDGLETGQTDTDTITYTVSDGEGGQSDGTLTVTIDGVTPAPVNTAPVATSDVITFERGNVALINVLANDSDADGDVLSIAYIADALNGTTSVENGLLRYAPDAGFVGTEALTYEVDDGNGGTATGTVSVTVTPPSGALGDQTGNTAAETFYHMTGNGSYTIFDYSGASVDDKLVLFDQGEEDLSFSQTAGQDLVITTGAGETITVINHFDGDRYEIELLEFADGTLLDGQGIRDKTVADMKSTGSVRGSEHQETYSHTSGDGSYEIWDFSYSTTVEDRLILTDKNAADVTFAHTWDKKLAITLGNGEVITIKDHFDEDREDMELIEFLDGTVLTAQGIRDKTTTDMKSTGVVRGSEYLDSYSHTLGDGSYTIEDFSYSTTAGMDL